MTYQTTRQSVLLCLAMSLATIVGCATMAAWPEESGSRMSTAGSRTAKDRPFLDPAKVSEELVRQHNRIRLEAKLSSLQASKKLQGAAEAHARDMAVRKKMTHTGSDGSTSSERIIAQGYRMRRSGENIAYGHFTLDEVMEGWMKSPPHRRNILGNFSQIGASCATAEDGTAFWCVTFGQPRRR